MRSDFVHTLIVYGCDLRANRYNGGQAESWSGGQTVDSKPLCIAVSDGAKPCPLWSAAILAPHTWAVVLVLSVVPLPIVVNETGRERFSLPFFYEPNIDAAVQPLPCTGKPRGRWATGAISPEQKLLRGLELSTGAQVDQDGGTECDSTAVAIGEYFHRPPLSSGPRSKL